MSRMEELRTSSDSKLESEKVLLLWELYSLRISSNNLDAYKADESRRGVRVDTLALCSSAVAHSLVLGSNHRPALALAPSNRRSWTWTLTLVLSVAVAIAVILCCPTIYNSCCPWHRHHHHHHNHRHCQSENFIVPCPVFSKINPILHPIISSIPSVLSSLFASIPIALPIMVSPKWGSSLAARAAFVVSSHFSGNGDQATSVSDTLAAVKALQAWYDDQSGLWNTTGWWNGANCLTVLADWALADQSGASSVGILDIMSNTFSKAQIPSASGGTTTVEKRLSSRGMPMSIYSIRFEREPLDAMGKRDLASQGFPGFINEYYDDEGWWALAWIRSWDVAKDPAYLSMAEKIFEDMKAGTDNVCGGGIWWSKDKKYKNAIANELYLSVAASLANRVPSKRDYYTKIARDEWSWFRSSGMINSANLINDGLAILDNGTCVNNKMNTWSYNQGVILGGLVELYRATGDQSLLGTAGDIADAAIRALADEKGIIHEIDRCEPNCGDDGSQFKGVFVRNLHYLYDEAPRDAWRSTISMNAASIWRNDRNAADQLGVDWSGPPAGPGGRGPTAGSHSSALDVLVADIALA